jgi:membrane protease YdiL (CAAX protease family)
MSSGRQVILETMMPTTTRHELLRFFGLTIAFSWLVWLPGVLTFFGVMQAPPGVLAGLKLLGAIGPALVALSLTWRTEGNTGLRRMIASSFAVRSHWRFWLGAALMLLALHALARLVLTQLVSDVPPSPLVEAPVAIVPTFVIMFLVGGGLGEEIGWRGYALDRLQTAHSALVASLLLAFVWIIWHLPLFFYGGTNQSLIPFWLFVLPVIPLSVMLTWIYNRTGTIFAVAFFHTAGNLAHDLFLVIPTADQPDLSGMVILTLFYYLAAVVIVVWGMRRGRG